MLSLKTKTNKQTKSAPPKQVLVRLALVGLTLLTSVLNEPLPASPPLPCPGQRPSPPGVGLSRALCSDKELFLCHVLI